jgi:gliding motility-associated-like protein
MSQGLYLDQASFYTENNTLFYVGGDIDLSNNGNIENNGSIELTRHWINNAGNTGLINNAPGTVDFIGLNQFIGGSSVTRFYDVNLLGGFVLKEAFQDVLVTNNLAINNTELQVHQNEFHLTNPNPVSLTWGNGFISGDSIGGYFSRSTNRVSLYRFPVGNDGLFPSQYRAIDITPLSSDSNVYGVRLAVVDASLDNTGTSFTGALGPYNRTLKTEEIIEVNPVFYHHVIRMYGLTPANIKMHYFHADHLSTERKLDGLAQWKSIIPKWDFMTAVYAPNISGPGDVGIPENSLSWLANSFDDDPFALTVLTGLPVYIPQIFSPNGDGSNDMLFVRGIKIKKLKFYIYDRWGEKVFETTDKNIGWDGLFRGSESQSSVYVYYLDAEIQDYGPYQQKGNITLVR